jgi:protein Mpv17
MWARLAAPSLAANAAIGFLIAAGGDVACQTLVEDVPLSRLDSTRTRDMGLIRAIVMAPFLYVYFPALARTVPGTHASAVLARVALDQGVGAPLSLALIFAASGALTGELGALPQRCEEQFLPTWARSMAYWPFVHVFNFRLVPPHMQPLVAHAASVPWNAVLSYRANVALGSTADAAPVRAT